MAFCMKNMKWPVERLKAEAPGLLPVTFPTELKREGLWRSEWPCDSIWKQV